MPVVEITEKLLPDLADAFDDWRRALEKVLDAARARTKNPLGKKPGSVTNAWSVAANASFAKVAPSAKNLSFASTTLVARAAPPASTKPAAASAPSATSAAWIGCIFHGASAVASREYSELLAAIAEAFEAGQPFEKVKPSSQAMAAIGFVVRLASARKPEDAKKLFEEEAAPLGTYKVKYDREGVTIAVNAFVGPFVARGKQFSVKDDTHYGLVVRPLSAPIGLDFTLASGKYCHFGLHGAVIDPFGVGTIDPEGEATELDWGAIVTPSLFARFGIGGSPFTVLGGVVWQPLAKSGESCANAAGASVPCWKGSLQFGGALAVDVPLLVLH
jgi:hypothetical protein